jgi:hypothetical protein
VVFSATVLIVSSSCRRKTLLYIANDVVKSTTDVVVERFDEDPAGVFIKTIQQSLFETVSQIINLLITVRFMMRV